MSSDLTYKVDHIPEDSNKRTGLFMDVEYITIHSTGNPNSTAAVERNWLTNPDNNNSTAFHIVVDEDEAIEVFPLDEVAWHAGDGTNGDGNTKSIGIEIIESGDREKCLEKAIEVTIKTLREHNLRYDALRTHNDWSGKNCPRILIDSDHRESETHTWDWFVTRVKNLMNRVVYIYANKESYNELFSEEISDSKKEKIFNPNNAPDDYVLKELSEISEGEKLYIQPNDAIYQELKDRFENNYESDYKEYFEAKTGKEIEIGYYQELEDNTTLLTTLLENYHNNFDISRQDDFNYFRVINDKIGLIDILDYIIQHSEAENEEDNFEVVNNILEGIDWENGEYNNIGQVDLETDNEENKYYRLLRTFSDNREQIYSGDSYNNIVSLDKKLLIDFIAEQMDGNIENGFDSFSRGFIYWYHEEAEVSLPGELYNELTGIDESYSILHILNFIEGKNSSSDFMDDLIADKTYEAFLEENFEESELETIIENDKRVLENKELINKFSAYNNIKRFLEEIDDHTDTDPVEQIIAEAEVKGRKIDNLSVAFLEKYNSKYGIRLVNEDPIYNSTRKIQENTDILIFPLMYRSVVLMEKEAGKTDDKLYKTIKTFANRCKSCLEEVIAGKGDYDRPLYKQDNDRDLTDYQLKNELINAFEAKKFALVDTEKSHEFFQSFLTAEDEEIAQTEIEEKKEKQRKEDSKKQAEEEEARKKQYARAERERRREEEEREKKSQGWKMYCKNDQWKIEARKDYFKA